MKKKYLFLIAFFLLMPSTTLLAKPKEIHVCEKHQMSLKVDRVPILYGLPSQEEFENLEYIRRNFPHANTYVLGGCVVSSKKRRRFFTAPNAAESKSYGIKA